MSNIQIVHTTYDTEYFTTPQAEYANIRSKVLTHIHSVLRDYTFDESRLYSELIVPYVALLGNVSGYELSVSNDWWIESFDNLNELIENVSREDEDVRVTQLGVSRCHSGDRMFVMYERRGAEYASVDVLRAVVIHGVIIPD